MNTQILILIIVLIVDVASALGVVYARHHSRHLAVHSWAAWKPIRDDAMAEWSRLQLEQAWLADAGQVEAKARASWACVSPGTAAHPGDQPGSDRHEQSGKKSFSIQPRCMPWSAFSCFASLAPRLARAVQLQVMETDFLQGQGEARFLREVDLPTTRGIISDRNGEPLAVSTPVDSVWVQPEELLQVPERIDELAAGAGGGPGRYGAQAHPARRPRIRMAEAPPASGRGRGRSASWPFPACSCKRNTGASTRPAKSPRT